MVNKKCTNLIQKLVIKAMHLVSAQNFKSSLEPIKDKNINKLFLIQMTQTYFITDLENFRMKE